MEILHESPKTSSFIPLAEHQSATPASFYDGPPVLHYYSARSKLVILSSDLAVCPPLATLTNAYTTASKQTATTNGHASPTSSHPTSDPVLDGTESSDITIPDVEIWATSSKFLIYSATATTGLSIPYPAISLHAIQSLPSTEDQPSTEQGGGGDGGQPQGLYMQLVPFLSSSSQQQDSAAAADEDEEEPTISLTIIPHPTSSSSSSSNNRTPTTTTQIETSDPTAPPPSQTTLLFNALSACSNLHPDPHNDDATIADGDITNSTLFQSGLIAPGNAEGGLPPPMPGSGGWITAENVGEYFDAEGNWIGGDAGEDGEGEGEGEGGEEGSSLGPGAGNVHPRPAEEDEGSAEVTGEENEESKWQRTA